MSVSRRVALVAVALVVGSGFGVGHAVAPDANAGAASAAGAAAPRLVQVVPNSSVAMWPHTSRRRTFASATLPINVVFHAHASSVKYVLTERADADWNVTAGTDWNGTDAENGTANDTRVVVNGTSLEWSRAAGATRYTYFRNASNGSGTWRDATFQVHDGRYFGSRYHLRIYESPATDPAWAAVQAHTEYWDWFRLRHTVGSLDAAQRYVEAEFYGEPYVAELERIRLVTDTYAAGRWVTVVKMDDSVVFPPELPLAVSVALVGLVARRRPEAYARRATQVARRWREGSPVTARGLLLAASMVAVMLSVRHAGVALEGTALGDSPKVIAGLLYPVLVLGLPAAALVVARGLDPAEAFAAAFVGIGAGTVVDFGYLGVAVLPIDLVLHRVAVMAAVGVVATGGARRAAGAPRWNRHVVAGTLSWIAVLAWPLFGPFIW